MAPLFLLSLALACAGSIFGTVAPWALSALAMAAAGWAGATDGPPQTWLSLAVLGFTAVVVANVLLIGPYYTPAGLYHPLLLLAGFWGVRQFEPGAMRKSAYAALALGGVLSVWGLMQLGLFGMSRAQAFFETPATYAAVINLLLVPVAAAILVGRRGTALAASAVALAAALFAAESRGGSVAFAAGLGIAIILALRAGVLQRRALGFALVLIAAGWIVAGTLRALPSTQQQAPPSVTARAESSLSRLELYALSWKAWREQPLSGTGYLTFRYTLEQGRAQVPSYGAANETWFVHNDYLQTLQELGPAGLLILLGLTVLPPIVGYRRLPALANEDRPAVVALASALAAMSVHALVDFPFYIPVCLLLYGALLGAFDRRMSAARSEVAPAWASTQWFRAARAGAVTVAAVVLLRPVAAEAAAGWALQKSASGDSPSAAFWIGAARRFDPRDWRYHWYAGQFWHSQAARSGKREAATFAADAFAQGFGANPLEVRNLLGMIAVHRNYRHLLASPADPVEMQQWRDRAAALAPLSPDVQRELAR